MGMEAKNSSDTSQSIRLHTPSSASSFPAQYNSYFMLLNDDVYVEDERVEVGICVNCAGGEIQEGIR